MPILDPQSLLPSILYSAVTANLVLGKVKNKTSTYVTSLSPQLF